MNSKYANRQYLYSINGEGRYTPGEVRRLTGIKNAKAYADNHHRGIRAVAVKVWRLWKDGKIVAEGEKLSALADNSYYSYSFLAAIRCRPVKHLKVDYYWEDIADGY